MRTGNTTGTCAAAAAKAAALLLCSGKTPKQVEVTLPDASSVLVPVLTKREDEAALATVEKDAGDDVDITDGMQIVVRITRSEQKESSFRAGEGIGTVTKPGLQVPPGEPAINPVPRKMILDALAEITEEPMVIEIAIPGGREVAQQTFNPRLGIEGGLSILGTSGIVRPHCKRAMCEAIRTAFDVALACGTTAPILVPGNIGRNAALRMFEVPQERVIEVGNDWDFALEELLRHNFREVQIVGHPGKLAKLIDENWNTHSANSTTATPIVEQVAQKVLGRKIGPSETVEGLFLSVSREEREKLAEAVATKIEQAVEKKIRDDAQEEIPVTVHLIAMSGESLQ